LVLGGGAAGVAAANRLAGSSRGGLEVVLVDRTGTHLFQPGLVAVMLGDAEPGAYQRPLTDLLAGGVKLLEGEVEGLDPASREVTGSFGKLGYDELVLALGAEVNPSSLGEAGELAPWTLAGALAGREALLKAGPGVRVVVGATTLSYRCPPAVFDLSLRLRGRSGAEVELVHPWPVPLAPFGQRVSEAFAAMLSQAEVRYHGGFMLSSASEGVLSSTDGRQVGYDIALLVPPHGPPAVVARSPLAGEGGWPEVSYPGLTHPSFPEVSVLGDLAAPALGVGMAGTLAVSEARHAAERLVAKLAGEAGLLAPQMSALCFVDTGVTGSALVCDFSGPASKTGPPTCVLLPFLEYFRKAKQLFAEEWFAGTLG
jgi:sulfide:quinone oxidoreductase